MTSIVNRAAAGGTSFRASQSGTSIGEDIEMIETRPEIDEPSLQTETDIDLPNVPRDVEDLKNEKFIEKFVTDFHKRLKLTRNIDPSVYTNLTKDADGQILYRGKRIARVVKGVLTMYDVNSSQMKNTYSREFLRLIGYASEETRDEQTVAPEQTTVIKSKIVSLKATEGWAKKEKDKATRQLEQTTDESERQKLEEAIQYFDQMEIQAKRRYNEVVQNQFARVHTIINDETRSLGERLKELFRRDGVTIGALITAIGMTISTIVLAVLPHGGPTPTPNNDKGYIDKFKASAKKTLIKLANYLLDLAKKALTALPGVIGSVVSFLLQKAGEAVLFLSEHLIIFFLALLLAVFEFIYAKIRKAPPK